MNGEQEKPSEKKEEKQQQPVVQHKGFKVPKTNLSQLIKSYWKIDPDNIDEAVWDEILSNADPEKATSYTRNIYARNMRRFSYQFYESSIKKGFKVKLYHGGTVLWKPPTPAIPVEKIYSNRNFTFTQDSANSVIALARLRGWKSINLSGTHHQRDMLWLAVQRQNLKEQKAFEARQADGSIKKFDDKGKAIKYIPITIANFTPEADSKLAQQWAEELATATKKKTPKPPSP